MKRSPVDTDIPPVALPVYPAPADPTYPGVGIGCQTEPFHFQVNPLAENVVTLSISSVLGKLIAAIYYLFLLYIY